MLLKLSVYARIYPLRTRAGHNNRRGPLRGMVRGRQSSLPRHRYRVPSHQGSRHNQSSQVLLPLVQVLPVRQIVHGDIQKFKLSQLELKIFWFQLPKQWAYVLLGTFPSESLPRSHHLRRKWKPSYSLWWPLPSINNQQHSWLIQQKSKGNQCS